MTPYLENLRRDFLFDVKQEYGVMEAELAEPSRRRKMLLQQITDAEEKLAGIRKRLDAMPRHRPGDPPLRRISGRLPSKEEMQLIREERVEEGQRADLLALENETDRVLSALRKDAVEVAEFIAARERVARAVTAQLREHALRRASVYLGELVNEHADGETLNAHLQPYLSGQRDLFPLPPDRQT